MSSRRKLVPGALALLLAFSSLGALAQSSAAVTPSWIPKDRDRYVDLTVADETAPPLAFKNVRPDTRTDLGGGKTMEVYTSIGNLEGGMDWRTVNIFAYLVNSVPVNKHSYTTLFNSLYDGQSIRYDSATGRWKAGDPTEVFAPTAAFLNQANKYTTQADRLKYIHVLGAKESMDEAYAARSSLARLVEAGYKSGSGSHKSVDYEECRGDGGCVTYTGSGNLMHSKFAAFEQAYDSQGVLRDHVVFITSSNLNGSSGSKKSNTSLVIYGDESAYNALAHDVFGTQFKIAEGSSVSSAVNSSGYKDAITLGADGVMKGLPTDSGVTFYPSPRAARSITDSVVPSVDAEAKYLKDRVAESSYKGPGCKVYLSHSLFNSTRGGVFDSLGALADQKCDVHVMLGTNAISDLVDGYFSMSANLRQIVDRVEFGNVHDKAFTYQFGNRSATFGGSANLTGTSLEYDELSFRADNKAVTDAVQSHLERVYQLARGQVSWSPPSSVAISPSGTISVKPGETVQSSTRVSPSDALVINTAWSSSNPGIASVSADGTITGVSPGTATITVRVDSPDAASRTDQATVVVSPTAETSDGSWPRVTAPPSLTMENPQAPPRSGSDAGTTEVTVTWGSGDKDYSGVVKLQYYSGGKWRTYPTWVMVDKGIGRIYPAFKSSKTFRAYGARLDGIYKDGQLVGNGSTAKTKSVGYSYSLVRSRTATSTPRLYAPSLAKSGKKVPMLVAWNRSGGVFRLQYKSGSRWKTYVTYRIPSGRSQEAIAIKSSSTKYWRIATSSGPTRVSNSVRIPVTR